MTPLGAKALVEMRKAGKRPSGPVWVSVGDFREPDWWKWSNTEAIPEIVVRPSDNVALLDFRCVVGLPVLLFLSEYNSRGAMVYQKLQEYAASIAVESPSFEEEIGWIWTKAGIMKFDGSKEAH